MAEELKPCPFCGCSMRLESNRDWHRIMGEHTEECVFTDSEAMMVPATDEQRDLAVADWNRRAIPADQVLVPIDLFKRLLAHIEYDAAGAPSESTASDISDELRALLQP